MLIVIRVLLKSVFMSAIELQSIPLPHDQTFINDTIKQCVLNIASPYYVLQNTVISPIMSSVQYRTQHESAWTQKTAEAESALPVAELSFRRIEFL